MADGETRATTPYDRTNCFQGCAMGWRQVLGAGACQRGKLFLAGHRGQSETQVAREWPIFPIMISEQSVQGIPKFMNWIWLD